MNIQNKLILINVLGVQDSGGITVLDKLLSEIKNSSYNFLIICNENENIKQLVDKYKINLNFEFNIVKNKGPLNRLYFENIIFRKIVKAKKIELVYNFSGSAQFFLNVPQVTKVHNLLFYSKKIDQMYFEKKEHFRWLKQIFLKRIVLHSMIRQIKYIEVQSNHVKEYMSDFINILNKKFFIKSDIHIGNNLFEEPKKYDFSKKLRFVYIVGPHFEYLHKNFEDFVKAMVSIMNENIDFKIIVTLTKEQLHTSSLLYRSLDDKTNFLGYVSKEELLKEFQDNTILISTSVIETLGLHVIEAVQNGILTITPNEKYAKSVYGQDITTYKLFDATTLADSIKKLSLLTSNEIEDKIIKNQNYLLKNEKSKIQSVEEIFDSVLKDNDV